MSMSTWAQRSGKTVIFFSAVQFAVALTAELYQMYKLPAMHKAMKTDENSESCFNSMLLKNIGV